jgi:hypothetical protein
MVSACLRILFVCVLNIPTVASVGVDQNDKMSSGEVHREGEGETWVLAVGVRSFFSLLFLWEIHAMVWQFLWIS